jgi:hypothetical protein
LILHRLRLHGLNISRIYVYSLITLSLYPYLKLLCWLLTDVEALEKVIGWGLLNALTLLDVRLSKMLSNIRVASVHDP